MDSFSTASSTAESQGRRSLWQRAGRVVDRALDLVFPPNCMECGGLVESGSGFRHLCEPCGRRLVPVEAPHCCTCGYPYFGEAAENSLCVHCEGLHPVYVEGRTVALLQGPLRRLVHALKYDRAFHVLTDIATIVRGNGYFCEFLAGARLVPVPLHPRKLRDRGYNQAELIAQCFAEASGSTVVPALRRELDTRTQTRLDREARRANLKNAFALAKAPPVEPSIRHVLVDDVFTTGATLNACAAVLRRAGVTRIDVATLGHG